jgi:hypothetical protein
VHRHASDLDRMGRVTHVDDEDLTTLLADSAGWIPGLRTGLHAGTHRRRDVDWRLAQY